jgi:hypothetical protein
MGGNTGRRLSSAVVREGRNAGGSGAAGVS